MNINEITGQQHRDVSADIDEDKLVAWVQKRCAPILQEYRKVGKPLYRGIMDSARDVSIQKVHKERTALTMQKSEIDDWHKSFIMAGLDATRRNSIFTSPQQYISGGFGSLYAVFPIGNFSYTWFAKQDGMYPLYDIKEEYHELTDSFPASDSAGNVFNHKAMVSAINKFSPQTTNLARAITGEKEVIIKCNTYLAIKTYKESLISKIIKG